MVLLILTDFSEAATNAAHYAVGLSKQLQIEKIVLYHSIETAHMATELPLPSETERRHLYEISDQKLKHLKEDLQTSLTQGITIEVLTDERPLEISAQAVARETNAGLLILGTTHRTGIEKMIYESTASLLSTTCTRPLLIVPLKTRYEPIGNMVFATDLRQVSAQTPVNEIRKFKELLQARLLVLNIFKEDDGGEPDQIMAEQTALHELLDEEHPEFHYSGSKHVVDGILKFISEHQIQLVITVPRKHSFLDAIFHPSITKSLASRSNIPLLLLHPEP
ncbi:MAG TPA: universal stress protein [Sphingobacteriaceae bacterium]